MLTNEYRASVNPEKFRKGKKKFHFWKDEFYQQQKYYLKMNLLFEFRLSAEEHERLNSEVDLLLKSIKGNFYTKNNS